MSELLLESVAEAPTKVGKRWRVVVARPGQGTSGKYSEDVLREYGPLALPRGSKAFFDHDPTRSIKDMVGSYPDGAYWDATNKELVAELQPFKHWQEVIDEVGPFAEASIYMMGEKDDDGNVTKLLPHRTNGADLVGYGGLEGSGLKEQVESLFEAARLHSESKPGTDSVQEKEKEKALMEKEILEAVKDLTKTLTAFVTEQKAVADNTKIEEANADTISTAVTEALATFKGKVKAIEDAKLLPSQVEALTAAAERGEDITTQIESAKKVIEEVKAVSLTEGDAGRSFGASNEDWTVAGVSI